jgi:hypothetical protein
VNRRCVSARPVAAVQRGRVDGKPERIAFSEGFAYIRRRSSPMLRGLPLEGLGSAGGEPPGVEIPMGSGPLGQTRFPTPADGIVTVPGGGALLVVSGPDRSVHYYKEGMSAPIGSFRLRNGEPRAVLSVDRSLQERRRSGFYETAARLPSTGEYRVVVFLDNPRVIHTFRFRVEPDPKLASTRFANRFDVGFPDPPRQARVDEPVTLRFRVTQRGSSVPGPDLADFRVQVALVPGSWSEWLSAEPTGDGWYEARFRPRREGVYFLFFGSASAGITPEQSKRHILTVEGRDDK